MKSRHENALPLIMTHGWPGSVVELLETVGPLTDPTAHGGRAEDAFHLVLPSIPGYGFSAEPTELGWGPIRIGQAWDELMRRLGYTRYVAQGGDVGSQVTDAMGRLGLDGLIGIHTNLLTPALGDAVALSASPPSKEERAALDQLDAFHATGTGYFVEQATRPETIGYALLDSPIALAAWMIDHDTDAYEKIARAFVDGQPSGNLTREHIVDNITLYWLTGTGASAARSYWEEGAGERSRGRPALRRRSRFRSASPRSPARSGGPRAAGSRRRTRTSSTSTRSTKAATSPRGRSRSCSPRRFARRSAASGSPALEDRVATTAGTPIGAKRPRRAAWPPPFDRASAVGRSLVLPVEGRLASFDGATGWLNSEPLTPGGSARARRPRRLLDVHVHQLAAHPAVRPGVGTRSTPTTA